MNLGPLDLQSNALPLSYTPSMERCLLLSKQCLFAQRKLRLRDNYQNIPHIFVPLLKYFRKMVKLKTARIFERVGFV